MKKLMVWIALALCVLACSEKETSKGTIKLYLTDAPVDAENIASVFISIQEIQLKKGNDWITAASFDVPLQVDILAYQNGQTYFVTEQEIPTGKYTEARMIVSDGSSDLAGLADLSYILYEDGSTALLDVPSGTSSGYKAKGEFELSAGGVVGVTLDFDVRKSIVRAGVSNKLLLKPVVGIVANQSASSILGTFNKGTISHKIVIYSYRDGEYRADENMANADGLRFTRSVNSTCVKEDGSFTLAFLEAGEYDLIFTTVTSEGSFENILGIYSLAVQANTIATVSVTEADLR
ncbi:MAG: DUF4382 domain-containing protein [Chryseotalea sp.]